MPTSKKGDAAKLPRTQEEIEAALKAGKLQMATADEVRNVDDTTYEYLIVPEWDNKVLKLQSLRKGQQQELVKRATVDEEIDDPLFQILCVIEAIAEPEFSKDDVETFKGRNAKAFNRLLNAAYKLSAMGAYASEAFEATFREEA